MKPVKVMMTVLLTVWTLQAAAPDRAAAADVRAAFREGLSPSWINIAHRGASGYAPENTIAAFELAFEMGADMLELDVQLSKDGQPVVIHDDSLERTSDGKGQVGALTLSELKRLDAGSWYAASYAGERIPTLEEVLKRFGGRIGLLIELKLPSHYPGLEEKVAEVVKRHALPGLGPGAQASMIVQSGDIGSLRRFHELMPDMPLGVVITNAKDLSVRRLEEYASFARYVNISVKLASRPSIRRIHAAGMKTFVWTIRDMLQVPFLLESRVDGIITDYPDRVPVSYTNRKAKR